MRSSPRCTARTLQRVNPHAPRLDDHQAPDEFLQIRIAYKRFNKAVY